MSSAARFAMRVFPCGLAALLGDLFFLVAIAAAISAMRPGRAAFCAGPRFLLELDHRLSDPSSGMPHRLNTAVAGSFHVLGVHFRTFLLRTGSGGAAYA